MRYVGLLHGHIIIQGRQRSSPQSPISTVDLMDQWKPF